jgi:hypothetical protein
MATNTPTDRELIAQLLAMFCAGVDRMDLELLRSVFHPHAQVDFGAFVSGPLEQYLTYLASPAGLPSLSRTMHQLGTINCEIDGNRARCESYVTAYHEGGADHPWCAGCVVICARYIDRLDRLRGQWGISSRVCAYEFARNLSTGEPMNLPEESQGRRDKSDPRYAEF